MQLTNILRDVGRDSDKGRIYIPLHDLNKFDYTEEELFKKEYNPNFVSLMKYEAEFAKTYFRKANMALDFDDKYSLFPARAMQHIYYKLLRNIEAANYDVLNNKIKVSKLEKTGIAVGVWAKYSLVY